MPPASTVPPAISHISADGPFHRIDGTVRVDSAFKAIGGIGGKIQISCSFADRYSVKAGTLEQDIGCRRRSLPESSPPMTPATATGSVAVADHQHVGISGPLDIVERGEGFLICRGVRTTMLSGRRLSKSKACSGWPYSSMTSW